MSLLRQQLKQWIYSHFGLSFKSKRVGPTTRCVVCRPVVGWEIGHEHIYHLDGGELGVWQVCDYLVNDPLDIEVRVVKEVVEEAWVWDWEPSSDLSWINLMYHFDTVEDSEL